MSAQSRLEEVHRIEGYRAYLSGSTAYLVCPHGELLAVSGIPSVPVAPKVLGWHFGTLIAVHQLAREERE